jgi:NAD(P)-dependent dehydrogenase (short-subunit alcohol dehydrogenase family)
MSQKIAYVTGGMGGIGTAICQRLHKEGFKVIAGCGPTRDYGKWLGEQQALGYTFYASVGNVGAWESTVDAFSKAKAEHGPIDVLVNNAGIGGFGAFEATPLATTREIFETNTFGVMAMTQAVVPGFRERRSGRVVNVTSSATLAPMPLVAVYTASKTAIEGFTASLAFELEDFDVSVKLVEPGYGPTTRFTSNGQTRMDGLIPEAYARFAQRVLADFEQPADVTSESDVADAVWRAANDTSGQLRFPAGADAVALAQAR